ncbi:MAG: aldo/keto reductase [Chloroflexi bacterium]|nr:aldo/keto reductase [Chloroflexota bacterium]
MQYRTLGRTGIRVSEIGLGAWELGGAYFLRDRSSSNVDPAGYDDVSEQAAIDMLRWGLDHGLTFIDTAPVYGNGESERRVARALARRSETVTVETKLGVFADEGHYRRLFSREVVLRECERSRERLGVQTIDIDLLHSPSRQEFGAGEALDAMQELKAQGKVRWIGVSASYDVQHTLELLATGVLDVLQIPLSILQPDFVYEVLPEALARNVGVVVREPLANGYLTGAFDEQTRFGADDQRSIWPVERHLLSVRKARSLEFLIQPGRSLAQASLAWVLAQPGVSTVIPGSANQEQLAWNLAASDVPRLSDGELARVAELQRTNFGLPVG